MQHHFCDTLTLKMCNTDLIRKKCQTNPIWGMFIELTSDAPKLSMTLGERQGLEAIQIKEMTIKCSA